jgi:hypothetical protein
MIEDYFDLVYAVGVVLIVCMLFIVARLIFDKGNEIQTKLATQNIGSTDAFGRLRIGKPHTLGDYKHDYGVNPDFLDYTDNGGTVTHNANEASVKLAVTNTIGSRAIHQTRMYHHYMPGKSQMILSSFVFKQHQQGISKKTGYFDDRDGIFFEEDENGILKFVTRSYVTGTAVDTIVQQRDWNGDKIDGKGLSGWKIDLTKTQLVWIDFQWLGVGRVRCGFVHKDEYVLCHTFYNSDVLDKVYMSNPNLPVRCEIRNINSSVGSNFDQICSSVLSEGGYREAGRDYSVLSSPENITNINAELNSIGILLKNDFNGNPNRIFVRLLDVKIFTSASNVKYEIIRVTPADNTSAAITDPQPQGTPVSANDDSGVNYINKPDIDANAKQEVIGSGIIPGDTRGQRQLGNIGSGFTSDAKKNYIAQNYDSTHSEAFVVRIIELESVDTEITTAITWREIY